MNTRLVRMLGVLFCGVWLMGLTGIARAQQDGEETRFGVPPAGPLTLDLSGDWRVKTVAFLDDSLTLPDYDDHDWREVKVPAHWSDQGINAGSGMPTVAIYRRAFRAPDNWGTQPIGIAAWLYPGHSTVTLNGRRLEPKGEAPWSYAEITDLLIKNGDNVLVVTTQYDGIYEVAFANPPRVGPLGQWDMPAVKESAVTFAIGSETLKATLYALDDKPHPGVLMMSTGSHGLAFTDPFIPLARELAYAGFAVMPVALDAQTPENITAALEALRSLPQVNQQRIGVVAGVASASTLLDQVAGQQTLAAIVALSAKEAPGAKGLSTPVLLIATTRDQTGPADVYARRIADNLAGPHKEVILPGTENGLGILDAHWNPAREAILDWFGKYLAAPSNP